MAHWFSGLFFTFSLCAAQFFWHFFVFCFITFYHHHLILNLPCMKETARVRISVKSSLNEISTDQLGQRGEGVTPPTSTPLYRRLLDRYLKTTWTVFPTISDTVFTSCIPAFTDTSIWMYFLTLQVDRHGWTCRWPLASGSPTPSSFTPTPSPPSATSATRSVRDKS